jgi:hypothetical protein
VLTRWKLASDRSQSCRHFLQLLQFLRTHFPAPFSIGPQGIMVAVLNYVCPLADCRNASRPPARKGLRPAQPRQDDRLHTALHPIR